MPPTAEEEEEAAASMRGYKMVNGKKTSYFHTELSDEAKKLLEKDAGPKKVSKEEAAKLAEAAKAAKGAGARHTYDNYQAKWDKWDNDEYIEQAMAEADVDVRPATEFPSSSSSLPSRAVSVRLGSLNLLLAAMPRCAGWRGGQNQGCETKSLRERQQRRRLLRHRAGRPPHRLHPDAPRADHGCDGLL
jgi:hypothetical protein